MTHILTDSNKRQQLAGKQVLIHLQKVHIGMEYPHSVPINMYTDKKWIFRRVQAKAN